LTLTGPGLRPDNVPGWKNTPLKLLLERKLRIPVLADNDVNIMALGECKFGAGKGARDAVCITLGTGVGGGIIIDGGLYRGATYSAGEVGHMPLKESGLACNCGGYGCLERYVGNRHISAEMKSAVRAGKAPGVKAMVKGDLSQITPELISKAARRGDRAAIALWERIGGRIGVTLSGIVNLLNPEMIIIGGGVADAGNRFSGL
jgi:glucokinase